MRSFAEQTTRGSTFGLAGDQTHAIFEVGVMKATMALLGVMSCGLSPPKDMSRKSSGRTCCAPRISATAPLGGGAAVTLELTVVVADAVDGGVA